MAVCAACKSIITDEASFCPHCGVKIAAVAPTGTIRTGTMLEVEGLGRVLVRERIGEGGMGTVYAGTVEAGEGEEGQRREVAVKALHPLLQGRPKARRLFIAEANALAMLAHPNIVQFYGFTSHESQFALVMELVHGRPLDHVLADHVLRASGSNDPVLPLTLSWNLLLQLLGALASLHALGIVHRDIKPSNVVIRHDGVVKLTDFGIARLPADAVSTTGGLAPGTGAYMAPEQILGMKLDGRADLYSAMIVFYELLCGRTPFEGPRQNEITLRRAQVEDVPRPIRALVPNLPEAIDVVMARCLAKNPDLRFSSSLKLAEVLGEALGLPFPSGWQAQCQLAQNAQAISQQGEVVETAPTPEQADSWRTAAMRGFGS